MMIVNKTELAKLNRFARICRVVLESKNETQECRMDNQSKTSMQNLKKNAKINKISLSNLSRAKGGMKARTGIKAGWKPETLSVGRR